MNRADTLRKILWKYKLQRPLPPELKKRILRYRKDTLSAILKRRTPRFFIMMAAAAVFLWAKRMGITLSFLKSAAVAGAVSVAAAGVAVTGAVYTVKKLSSPAPARIEVPAPENKEEIKSGAEDSTRLIPMVRDPSVVKTRIAVLPFEFMSDDGAAAREARARITDGLLHARKGVELVSAESPGNSLLIMGIVIREGDEYVVSVRLVQRADSQIVLLATERARGRDGLQSACRAIVDRIAGKL